MLFLFLAAAQFQSPIFSKSQDGDMNMRLNIGDGYTLRTMEEGDFDSYHILRSDPQVTALMACGARSEEKNRERFD